MPVITHTFNSDIGYKSTSKEGCDILQRQHVFT